MMSRQVKKFDRVPLRTWYGMAAGAVFVMLLAALVHVLNGQVKQAQFRQMQYRTTQAALSGCGANHSGAARSKCVAQLSAGNAPKFTQLADVELLLDAQPEHPGLLAGQSPPKDLAGMAPGGLTETAFVR